MSSSGRIELAMSRIEWRDLVTMSAWERFCAVTISLPLFAAALFAAASGHLLLAFGIAFFYFTAALRQAHDAFHLNIGLSKGPNDVFLGIASLMMLAPLHAIRYCHLIHHLAPLSEADVEGSSGRMSGLGAILTGPLFTARVIARALVKCAAASRVWIVAEVVAIVGYVLAGAWWGGDVWRFHVLAMLLANCLTGFFAVWVVHHDCDLDGVFARTQRTWWLDVLTFNLLYHFEHHIFPAVPSCKLPELARRFDEVLPEISDYEVVPLRRRHGVQARRPARSDSRPFDRLLSHGSVR